MANDSNSFVPLVVFAREILYPLVLLSFVWKYLVKRYLGLLKITLGSQ